MSDRGILTYREVDQISNRLANGTTARGITSGDGVLVVMPNVVEFILAWLGLGKTGAIRIPFNTAVRGRLLAHLINDSAARVMIVAAGFLDPIADVASDLPYLERLIVARCRTGFPTSIQSTFRLCSTPRIPRLVISPAIMISRRSCTPRAPQVLPRE